MTDTKSKPYAEWSDKDLAAEQERLAKERTAVREAQVAVAAELEIRQSLADLSPETRKVIELRLGGSIASSGESKGAAK